MLGGGLPVKAGKSGENFLPCLEFGWAWVSHYLDSFLSATSILLLIHVSRSQRQTGNNHILVQDVDF